jgi:hypothetical protein
MATEIISAPITARSDLLDRGTAPSTIIRDGANRAPIWIVHLEVYREKRPNAPPGMDASRMIEVGSIRSEYKQKIPQQ